ncbi:4Fe-4S ferredoxin, iron-sulfur binding domain protein [Gottschalkia purinilytica]|uniref:4Fe-4S ferredoxin, iron-sulfur binding domain protein n=1 Tax=Gottschalkia purinilytica TaxID=1503 RepID=A0A0L0WBY2_GOTPU|nr:EFR1 family ferrodoxin [Gottschalkia purinilytica]KNF08973.1 4Fe-4S ferredoxin, iron-sulfur binding domain protein [Gottschalkia purinilytica]
MIFYFTGTGNSLHIAKEIGKYNEENISSIASIMNSGKGTYEHILKESESIGFVFPVYAWGPPKIVLDFIDILKLENYNDNYIFAVATCGDNTGNTLKLLEKQLKNRKLNLDSGFSIRMPNNYLLMFDVDDKTSEHNKLKDAEKLLEDINKVIEERKKNVFIDINKFSDGFYSKLIYPLFNKFALNNTKKFHVNDKCTTCGLCESICVVNSIKVNGKPTWNDKCVQCMGCINWCPVNAIQYGKSTEKKGRYTNPNVKITEMKLR